MVGVNHSRTFLVTYFVAQLLVWLSISGCQNNNNLPEQQNSIEFENLTLEHSTPEMEGFEKKEFQELMHSFYSQNSKLNSVVVARNGKLVYEAYYNGCQSQKPQKIWSITKAVSATLIGIAENHNLLSEKDSIIRYLNPYLPLLTGTEKGIRISNLLNMTSGYEWTEMGGPSSAGFRLAYSNDWISFVLSQKHASQPGKTFNYSTGNSVLLAPIIKSATGFEAEAFAQQHLFNPMGIQTYNWDKQSEFWSKTQSGELPGAKKPDKIIYKEPFSNYTNTGSGLRMTAIDLCKFGHLFVDKGKWKNKQIVSKEWIEKTLKTALQGNRYGYHWRYTTVGNRECWFASGFGAQRIFIIPDLHLVVVLTQKHYTTMPQGEKMAHSFMESLLKTLVD